MPAPIVSPILFNAHALAAMSNEPHAKPGNHLRISSHPKLGLPVAPFLVWRAVVDNVKGLTQKRAVNFKDSKDRTLIPPFTLTPDNPVTAYLLLKPGEICYWAEVVADPIGSPNDSQVRPNRPRRRFPISPVFNRPIRLEPVITRPFFDTPIVLPQLRPNGMEAEAYINSAYAPASIGKRNTPRFAFHAPGIVKIELRGSAVVTGLRWLEMHDVQRLKFEPWTLLNLPHKGGARYISIEDAVDVAKQRVRKQAPKRQPLQETSTVQAPINAPFEGAEFESKRVMSLSAELEPHLDSLISDLSIPQLKQIEESKVFDENNKLVGDVSVHRLAQILQGIADPGVAGFMGYKAYDDQFVEQEQRLVFYWVDGFFQRDKVDKEDLAFNALFNTLQPANHMNSSQDLVSGLLKSGTGEFIISKESIQRFKPEGQIYRLGTLAVADRSVPLLPPTSPRIDSVEHIDWIPTTAPHAMREVTTYISKANVAGLLAAKKKAPANTGSVDNLHQKNTGGFHLPLILGLNSTDEEEKRNPEPGQGFVNDRQATNDAIRYYVAQQDRFGRWSTWASAVINPAERPKPPRPVFQAYYLMPEVTDPMLAGKVRVIVHIPEIAALAPASHLLSRFRLTTLDVKSMTSQLIKKGISTSPPEKLEFKFDAPLLTATETRKLELIAHWKDTAGQLSAPSEKIILTLHDPRPPAQITVPNTLQYAARPDITGLSIVEYEWLALQEQSHFAIYYTDENRLNAYLVEAAAEGSTNARNALQTLENAGTPLQPHDRAAVYRNQVALFGQHLWERLENVNIDLPENKQGFRHAVPGSLRILNFYRIVAESENGVGPVFNELPMMVYGVPNSDPPAKPLLSATLAEMASNTDRYQVQLDVRILKAATRAEQLRIRRSSLGIVDPLRVPIVNTAPMDTELEETEHDHATISEEAKYQHGHLLDTGSVKISASAQLLPWVRYFWVAEVQGAPEPGSTISGKWSQVSDPVSLLLIPPSSPEPASVLQVTGTEAASGEFESLTLHFTPVEILLGGSMGAYSVRVQRQVDSEQPMQLVSETEVSGNVNVPFELSISGAGERFPANTRHTVVIIDPLGRESTMAETALIIVAIPA